MKRPFALIALLIVVALFALFVGALVAEQMPIWTAPRPDWIQRLENGAAVSGDAPAACEAADLLARHHAARDASITSGQTQHLIAARVALQKYGVLPADSPVGYGTFILTWEERRTRAALVTYPLITQNRSDAALLDRPAMAGMVVVDADTNGILATWIIPGGSAVNPADACPFDLRGALVDLVRSRPFIGLMVFIGLIVIIGGAGLIARRLNARRRNKNGTTAVMG